MRLLCATIVLVLAGMTPPAAAHPGHHGPGYLLLHGNLLDEGEREFGLSPFLKDTRWVKVPACRGPSAFLPEDTPKCNTVTYLLRPGLARSLPLEGASAKVRFFLSSDATAAARDEGATNAPTVGGTTPVGVEATLTADGALLSKARRTSLLPSSTDGKPIRYDFDLAVPDRLVPKARDLQLQMRWWQGNESGTPPGTGLFVLHAGRDYGTQVEFPIHLDPFTVHFSADFVDMGRACASSANRSASPVDLSLVARACGNATGPVLAYQSWLVPTFENLSDVPINITMRLSGARAPTALFGPFVGDGADGGRKTVWVWDYARDRVNASKYVLETHVQSAGVTEGFQEGEIRLSQLTPIPPAKETPAWSSAAVMLALAFVAFACARRAR